jgi:hypothetical protein
MVFLRAFAVWLAFMVAESGNGILRELWLVPVWGSVRAHQVSFFTGLMLILTIVTLSIRWLQASRISQLVQVGSIWLILTLGFEIGLGRFVLGYPWAKIAADYDLSQGGLMAFGLAFLIVVPLIAAKLRGVLPGSDQLA